MNQFQIDFLITEFNRILKISWEPTGSLRIEAEKFLKYLSDQKGLIILDSKKVLLKSINSKFDLNREAIKEFYRWYALKGFTFNYHQKLEIREFININNVRGLTEYLKRELNIKNNFFKEDIARPLEENETLVFFGKIYAESENKNDICSSLFSTYIFNLCETKMAHSYFSNTNFSDKPYFDDFYEHLLCYEPNLLKRKEGLRLLKIDEALIGKYNNYSCLTDVLYKYISDSFRELSNHSYLGILINISDQNHLNINKWELLSDIQIYAEKFLESPLKIGYFHPDKIEATTKQYIPLDQNVDFSTVNEGFHYKDCFILSHDSNGSLKDKVSFKQYDVLLLMEKNERDERIVPCPSCRSKKVRGNSYPIIGVKSWECYNDLCPDKSKSNRGKRYSLASLIKQEAIDNEENLISEESVKKWRLDVTNVTSESEILEFLITHYSLVHDTIVTTNFIIPAETICYRKLQSLELSEIETKSANIDFFRTGSFLKRIYGAEPAKKPISLTNISPIDGVEVYNEDCLFALQQFASNTFDGAVTSPPYYNAKSYSQWPNIYCYLYDMHNINREIFRVLKEGGIFLYNIFDYFDNENNVVFSAMGKKRLILGAYLVNSFKKLGFEILGNIIWFKGEIQGKRNFNQGNFSPYYQAPLNSYEHIFVLSKPPKKNYNLPQILAKKPVFKIINGKNVVGHEAPYPEAIPNLLFEILREDARYILDPFGGTMTTAKAAFKRNIKSVSIEKNSKYCNNEIRNLKNQLYSNPLL